MNRVLEVSQGIVLILWVWVISVVVWPTQGPVWWQAIVTCGAIFCAANVTMCIYREYLK